MITEDAAISTLLKGLTGSIGKGSSGLNVRVSVVWYFEHKKNLFIICIVFTLFLSDFCICWRSFKSLTQQLAYEMLLCLLYSMFECYTRSNFLLINIFLVAIDICLVFHNLLRRRMTLKAAFDAIGFFYKTVSVFSSCERR